MGLDGFLPTIGAFSKTIKIYDECFGAVVGIDSNTWLYRISLSYDGDRNDSDYLSKGIDFVSTTFLGWTVELINRGCIKPVYVFDGSKFAGKRVAHVKRAVANPPPAPVNRTLMLAVIRRLRRNGVTYCCSSFEADVQL